MRKTFIIMLGIVSMIALTSVSAFSKPQGSGNAQRCKDNWDICVTNAIKCSNVDKCEYRCFDKYNRCIAGLPPPVVGLNSGRNVTLSGQANFGLKPPAGPTAAGITTLNGGGKSAVGSATWGSSSAVSSQPAISSSAASTTAHIGSGGSLYSTRGTSAK